MAGKIEAQAIGSNAARPLQSSRMEQIAGALIPDASKFKRQIGRESDMFANRAQVVGGSQTANNLADMNVRGAIPSLLRGDWKGALGISAIKASQKLGGLDQSTRTEIARMLMEKGGNDRFIAIASRKLARGQKLSEAQTRLIYGAIIMASNEGAEN